MNNPEYIVVDELKLVATEVKTSLALSSLNYQYGYVKELDQTLTQWSKNTVDSPLKFPLIYVEQPFKIVRGASPALYGRIEVLRMFIINQTTKTWTAEQRMTNNFKPVIYPIQRELLKQLDLSVAFHTQLDRIKHTVEDRYYWGESQASVFADTIDCVILTIRDLEIANNPNCIPGQ